MPVESLERLYVNSPTDDLTVNIVMSLLHQEKMPTGSRYRNAL
jgi:hypothetical protein